MSESLPEFTDMVASIADRIRWRFSPADPPPLGVPRCWPHDNAAFPVVVDNRDGSGRGEFEAVGPWFSLFENRLASSEQSDSMWDDFIWAPLSEVMAAYAQKEAEQ